MNKMMNLSNKCSWYPGKRPASSLTHGVYFMKDGQRVKFLHYTGYPYSTRNGMYQQAWVLNSEGNPKKVSLNQAGSVELA